MESYGVNGIHISNGSTPYYTFGPGFVSFSSKFPDGFILWITTKYISFRVYKGRGL